MSQNVPELVARIMGFPRDEVKPSSSLQDDLGLDPYDVAELAEELESKLGARIPDASLGSARTVADLGRSLHRPR